MRKKARGPKRTSSTSPAIPPGAATGVQFLAVINRGLSFLVDESKASQILPAPPGTLSNVSLAIGYEISELPAEQGLGAAVSLDITATPDQNHQPYVVRAKVSGIFAAPPGISAEAFREFCNEAAPTILFPFVRQKIVDASADAPFGPIVLNPVNLRAHFQAVRDAAAKELLESKSL